MKRSLPHTPFSTPFSPSKRMVEARIRGILAGPQKRPPLPLLALVLAFCFLSVNLVSCQPAQTEDDPDGSAVSPADNSSQQEGPELMGSDSLERLTLDGTGRSNDAVTVNSYWSETENYDGTYTYASRVEVEVTLNREETLTWELERELGYFPRLFAVRLKDPDRDAIVLELDIFGSQYGEAEYHTLEVADGALTEIVGPIVCLPGAKTVDLDYNLLQAIRLPTFVHDGHSPEWYTLEWNGEEWNLAGDGYFTDYYDLDVPGHKFTLALRGRSVQPGAPYYPGGPQNTGDRPDPVYDDLIQLYDNGLTSYAFTSESFTPDPGRPFDGFRWEYKPDAVQVRDVNFDGADDFGILCDATHNDTHCWFVWDEDSSMFRYFASLGSLDVNRESQQLIETLWDDGTGNTYKNVYELDGEGGLLLVAAGN